MLARPLLASMLLVAFALLAGAPTLRAQDPPPDLILDGGRLEMAGSHSYGRVVLRNRARIEIQPYSGTENTGWLELRADYIEIDRSSSIEGDEAGSRGQTRNNGEGPGGGEGGRRSADGGGGGGYGGRGGDGVLDNQPRPAASGGREYGADCSREIQRGSAGGAPGTADNSADPGGGGKGGGALALIAQTVIITGTLSMNGADGVVAANDAAGGGAGGGVLVIADQLEQSGRIEADGGDGGVTDDGGGGGGGGRIKLLYASGNTLRRVLSVDGGKGDGNGYRNDGNRGTICIEEIPPTATATTEPSATPTEGPSSTPTPEPSATPTEAPPSSPTPLPSATLTPSATATATSTPSALYLPLLLRERCPDLPVKPIALALVIDASTSMHEDTRAGRPKLEAARQAARTLVELMGRGAGEHRLALVQFNESAELLAPLTSERAQLETAIARIEVARGSRIDAGLRLGAEALASAAWDSERRLVLVTDGLPSPSTSAQVLDAAAGARDAGIVIDAIGLGEDVDPALLRQVAGDPARYHEAPDAEDLGEIFRDLTWVPPPCGGARLWPEGL